MNVKTFLLTMLAVVAGLFAFRFISGMIKPKAATTTSASANSVGGDNVAAYLNANS
jgi:hypothetical protein